jgi:hypothetical protein
MDVADPGLRAAGLSDRASRRDQAWKEKDGSGKPGVVGADQAQDRRSDRRMRRCKSGNGERRDMRDVSRQRGNRADS